jgi:putative transcriptional regulator
VRADERLTNRIREERVRLGLTQAQLATRAGVSRKTINTVENGVFVPSTVLALRLAKVLGTTVEDLFALDPDWAGDEREMSAIWPRRGC